MSIVEPDTGELTVLLTKDEAWQLTAKIKSFAGVLCQLVKEAHDKQAWRAMGYGSWGAYTKAEFDISRSRSYQLIKYAEVAVGLAAVAQVPVEAITEALPEGTARNVTPDVIDEVSTSVDSLGPDAPLEDRLDAAMAKVKEASPSPAVLAARARREAEAAEPEQVSTPSPAPVPTPAPDAPQAASPAGLSDAQAATGSDSAPDPVAPSPESDAFGPLPTGIVVPDGFDWDVVFAMSPENAVRLLTDSDDLAALDDAADWLFRFFAARKEMAA